MGIMEEIKERVKMEMRPNSREGEYLEAVVERKNLESLNSILTKHLGPAAKEAGKEASLATKIQEKADSMGGLRIEQSFYYKAEGDNVVFAALWPWASNGKKITLKLGISKA